MGKGSIKFPEPSPEEKAYFAFMTSHAQKVEAQDEIERNEEKTRKTNLKNTGIAGFDAYKNNVLNQYKSGLIDYDKAEQRLKDYGSTYNLTGEEFTVGDNKTSIQSELNALRQQDVDTAASKRSLLAKHTYQTLLGKDPTEAQMTQFEELSKTGGYSLANLAEDIKSSDDYKKKFEQSYLENYLNSMYGGKTTETDEGGRQKDVRSFKYSSTYAPKFAGDLKSSTGLDIAAAPSTFTGSVEEIKQFQEDMRQKQNFMYNAGLTNLQGQIDKDTQKIKNEGTADVARIGTQGQLLSNLTAGFWS